VEASASALAPLRKRAKQLMERIETRTKELEDIEHALADPAIYDRENRERMGDLLKRQGELRRLLEDLEAEWVDAEEALRWARTV